MGHNMKITWTKTKCHQDLAPRKKKVQEKNLKPIGMVTARLLLGFMVALFDGFFLQELDGRLHLLT